MRFPIDVVFLDSDLVVLKIDAAVPPFRTAACRGAREVVELRAGECERRGLAEGDRVTWAPVVDDEALPDVDGRTGTRRGRILLASRDPRFIKLTRVLLDGRGLAVTGAVPLEQLVEELADADVDVVVLDTGDDLAGGLRLAGTVAAAHPELVRVMAGESIADRAPQGMRVFDKWNETEEMMAAVEHGVDSRTGSAVGASS